MKALYVYTSLSSREGRLKRNPKEGLLRSSITRYGDTFLVLSGSGAFTAFERYFITYDSDIFVSDSKNYRGLIVYVIE